MTKPMPLKRSAAILPALALMLAVACTPVQRFHGYAPTDTELAQIEVGRDTRESVAEKVGRPVTGGLMEGSGWYYVQSDWVEEGWRAPVEVDRQVVAITFDGNDRVQNIERFGIEDGQVVALSRRVTDTGPTGGTLLRRLFGNLGRILPGL